jgi:intracellular septation protein
MSDTAPPPVSKPRRMKPLLRHALEFGPVLIFFGVMQLTDVFIATAVLMGLMSAAALTAYLIEGRLSGLILFGLVTVLAFGTLTLVLHDEEFIKIRPSIYFATLAAVIAFGMLIGRVFLKSLFEYAFQIDDDGWRKLSWRMAGLFAVLSGANLAVASYFSLDTWATYKVFGVPVLTMIFMIAQTPLLLKHQLPDEKAEPKAD